VTLSALAVVAVGFAIAVVAVASPFFIAHKIAQWFLRDRWKIGYVRLSVDVTIVGFYVLILATGFSKISDYPQVLRDGEENWSHWPQALTDSANKLSNLEMLSCFLDNFPRFVILPGGVVLFAGYSLERAKQAKNSTRV
jgi:hypothetical protein